MSRPVSCRRAVEWLETTIKENDISCDWQRAAAYVFPEDQQQDSLAFLDKELQVLSQYSTCNLSDK